MCFCPVFFAQWLSNLVNDHFDFSSLLFVIQLSETFGKASHSMTSAVKW